MGKKEQTDKPAKKDELTGRTRRGSESVQIQRLKKIAELSMLLAGDPVDVFSKIARMIAELLHVPIVCLSEIRDRELHFLSIYRDGETATNAGNCTLAITPCATVEQTKDIRIYSDVANKFPKSEFLKEHNAYSYCGFPSLDSSGDVVAVTCLLDDQPHEFSEEDKDLLQIFAQRIAVEIERQKNIRERQRAEQALQANERKYRALVDSTDDSIYLIDGNYRYLFINKKHLSRLGLPAEEIIGRSYQEFHSQDETDEFVAQVDTVLRSGESVQHEHKSRRDDRYFLRTLSPVKDMEGSVESVIVVSKHITERKRMEEKLLVLSLTDELTGLYNRRGFLTLAEQQIKLANRLGKRLMLLSADLDNLKWINDTLGHQEGDSALVETASVLRESYRNADIIARIGGDEFMVLFLENKEADPESIISRLKRTLDSHNKKGTHQYVLSISVGMAVCEPECLDDIYDLMIKADKLMYAEKKERQKLQLQ